MSSTASRLVARAARPPVRILSRSAPELETAGETSLVAASRALREEPVSEPAPPAEAAVDGVAPPAAAVERPSELVPSAEPNSAPLGAPVLASREKPPPSETQLPRARPASVRASRSAVGGTGSRQPPSHQDPPNPREQAGIVRARPELADLLVPLGTESREPPHGAAVTAPPSPAPHELRPPPPRPLPEEPEAPSELQAPVSRSVTAQERRSAGGAAPAAFVERQPVSSAPSVAARGRATAADEAPEPAQRSGFAPAAPPPAAPPQVLIDQIHVITPPAVPAPADPFASLSEQRVGASLHGGASWAR